MLTILPDKKKKAFDTIQYAALMETPYLAYLEHKADTFLRLKIAVTDYSCWLGLRGSQSSTSFLSEFLDFYRLLSSAPPGPG